MTTVRTRREPPAFQRMEVAGVEPLTPRMVRVTFTGALRVDEPAASVRVLLPSPGAGELVIPTWSGNEFLLPDGSRPIIRTFTPQAGEQLAIDIVLHGHGAASTWVANAQPGAPLAVSGPGKGYVIDSTAAAFRDTDAGVHRDRRRGSTARRHVRSDVAPAGRHNRGCHQAG